MKYRLLYLFLIAAIASGCKKENTVKPEDPTANDIALISVTLEAKNSSGKFTTDIPCTIVGDQIYALVSSIENNRKFVPSFNVKNATVTVNDTVQTSGVTLTDFRLPVTYKLTSPKGVTKTYTFNIRSYTGIPLLYLNTSAAIDSKDVYVTGTLVINSNALFAQEKASIPLQVKGRGNSTWAMPKKPYRLKFTDKAAMLGMPAAKNWVLLANYSDKTLLRTSLSLDLGRKLNADFTPKGQFVELVLNGVPVGSYYLTSQVEVHENRVNITELKKSNTSASEITGGYLIEQDERLDEATWWRTGKNLPMTIKSPEDITPAQLDYIKTYIQDTENSIFAANFADPVNGYNKYINTASFINWFLVQELMRNQDAQSFSSIFYYKDRNGKLGMGPLWDFDLSMGNNDYSVSRFPTGWWVKDGPWFSKLFQDPAFRAKVKARWAEIRNREIADLPAEIDKTAAYIRLSQQKNFEKWPILSTYVWPNQYVLGTYDKEVEQVKKWLAERVAWLDTEIGKF